MVNLCPFCGNFLMSPIHFSGITSCQNCNRIFDDADWVRILCAAWACRKNPMIDPGYLKDEYQLNEEQANFIQQHLECSHDEIYHLLKAA